MTARTQGERIGRCLYGAAEISEAVERLAAGIACDYAGKPLVLLGVLKGALYFTVDLARALAEHGDGPSEIIVEYVCVTSYGAGGQSRGQLRLLLDETVALEGRDVVVVEDIADNGLTLKFLQSLLIERRPASLRTCVLFDKPANRTVPVRLDYVGLTVPNAFVIGYGLDYQERYRNLPYLAELQPQESQLEAT
ncbi:MAG TPA: hypoxanthine phosphoribosyltransferase [Candidatus Baltobacteraceae bacterium]|nr:hypoxanthine phosphoribosyltransferase [Candidatus Baltobacteraceae bacterium]